MGGCNNLGGGFQCSILLRNQFHQLQAMSCNHLPTGWRIHIFPKQPVIIRGLLTSLRTWNSWHCLLQDCLGTVNIKPLFFSTSRKKLLKKPSCCEPIAITTDPPCIDILDWFWTSSLYFIRELVPSCSRLTHPRTLCLQGTIIKLTLNVSSE